MIKTMTISRRVQPDMNMSRRDILFPTVQKQRERKIITKKVQTITIRRHVENEPKQSKRIINKFNLNKTKIIKKVKMMTTDLQNLDYAMLEADINYTL